MGPTARAPEPPAEPAPAVLVQRSIPTPPSDRGSARLYLAEAERQGIRADRRMLYIGLEPATEHVAHALRVTAGDEVVARRELMLANDVPVRIATSFFRADLFTDTRMNQPEFVRPTLQAALEERCRRSMVRIVVLERRSAIAMMLASDPPRHAHRRHLPEGPIIARAGTPTSSSTDAAGGCVTRVGVRTAGIG